MEDGEIEDGFLGHHEMESRRALAAAHGAEGSVSWVEAVLLGAGDIAPLNEAEDEEDDDLVPENSTNCATVSLNSRSMLLMPEVPFQPQLQGLRYIPPTRMLLLYVRFSNAPGRPLGIASTSRACTVVATLCGCNRK